MAVCIAVETPIHVIEVNTTPAGCMQHSTLHAATTTAERTSLIQLSSIHKQTTAQAEAQQSARKENACMRCQQRDACTARRPPLLAHLHATAHSHTPTLPTPTPHLLVSFDGVPGLSGHVLVHRLDALRHRVLGQLARQKQASCEHDVAARDGVCLVVLEQQFAFIHEPF